MSSDKYLVQYHDEAGRWCSMGDHDTFCLARAAADKMESPGHRDRHVRIVKVVTERTVVYDSHETDRP